MSPYAAEQLKKQGNEYFKLQQYQQAETLYGQAIQQHASNPLLYTNRANARLKLKMWDEVIDDCIRSIDLNQDNMKGFYFLGQAQLELHRPNEALSSALTAYELCSKSPERTSSAFAIAGFVMRCKRAKWDLRERDRIRRHQAFQGELEAKLDEDRQRDLALIGKRFALSEIGSIAAEEEQQAVQDVFTMKINDLRNIFALGDPSQYQKREIPDYLIDDISFEIMHDPVITKHGHSYDRATIVEHLKRNPTDPLTREPLQISDLRTNLALKQACDAFWENNAGWAVQF